jgi:hypothetical protein
MCLIEVGHFYECKGPNQWSAVGWKMAEEVKEENDKRFLFIDDVHKLSDVHH